MRELLWDECVAMDLTNRDVSLCRRNLFTILLERLEAIVGLEALKRLGLASQFEKNNRP